MPDATPMMQFWSTSGPGPLMYLLLWAALLCCRIVRSMSTIPLSRTVITAKQLVDAVRDGVRDIEVRAHIDLRTIAQQDQLTDTLIVPAAVQTIRVRPAVLSVIMPMVRDDATVGSSPHAACCANWALRTALTTCTWPDRNPFQRIRIFN